MHSLSRLQLDIHRVGQQIWKVSRDCRECGLLEQSHDTLGSTDDRWSNRANWSHGYTQWFRKLVRKTQGWLVWQTCQTFHRKHAHVVVPADRFSGLREPRDYRNPRAEIEVRTVLEPFILRITARFTQCGSLFVNHEEEIFCCLVQSATMRVSSLSMKKTIGEDVIEVIIFIVRFIGTILNVS